MFRLLPLSNTVTNWGFTCTTAAYLNIFFIEIEIMVWLADLTDLTDTHCIGWIVNWLKSLGYYPGWVVPHPCHMPHPCSTSHQLILDSPQRGLVPFALSIHHFHIASSNADSLTNLPCQAVTEATSDFCLVTAWQSLVVFLLVFLHKTFSVPVPVAGLVFLDSGVNVPRALSYVQTLPVIRT